MLIKQTVNRLDIVHVGDVASLSCEVYYTPAQ